MRVNTYTPGREVSAPGDAKIRKAAGEFEGLLLSSLLRDLEKTFSSVEEKGRDFGSEQYSYMGVQALGTAIAGRGGIGIADLIVRHLDQGAGTSSQ